MLLVLLPPHLRPCSAARPPLDLDKHTRHASSSSGGRDTYAPVRSPRDFSPDYNSVEPKRSRHPKQDSAAPHSRSRYPEHHLAAEGGRSRPADPFPDHLLPSRGRHGDRYPDYEPTETGRSRGLQGEDTEHRVVRRKERPGRPPPPQSPRERDKPWDPDRKRDKGRDLEGTDRTRDRNRGARAARDRERSRDGDRQRARPKSRERSLQEEFSEPPPRGSRGSWEEEEEEAEERTRRAKGRQRDPDDVFEDHGDSGQRGGRRDPWGPRQGEGPDEERSQTPSYTETGTALGCVCCAGAAFRFADLRWWVRLTSESLITPSFPPLDQVTT